MAHPHSNMARKIAFRHIVGIVERSRVSQQLFSLDDSLSMQINKSTKSFVLKPIISKTEPNEKPNPDLKKYYQDISYLGKHYTFAPLLNGKNIRENKNRVLRRHYTIANCMQREFYQELIKAVSGGDFRKELVEGTGTGEVIIAVKNYGLSKGVARRLFTVDEAIRFDVKGPMGRGLGLTCQSAGSYVAFGAGTGVFVYIDLVARIALGILDLIP